MARNVNTMICPVCRHKLPLRFALATSLTSVVCRKCHATLRPTAESANQVAKLVFMPSAKVGAVGGALGTWYGIATGSWAPFFVTLVVMVSLSFVVSWWLATTRVVFERA